MTHKLQKLLQIGDDNPLFNSGIIKLEISTGNSGVDTRLIADIISKSHKVIRQLGLEINDTTGKELYYALCASVWRDDYEDLLEETDFVLVIIDDQIISFNMIDVIENAHHELPFGKQIIKHGQRSLRGELLNRYISHERTDNNTTIETIKSMGILPESDKWYNNDYYKHNRKELPRK